MYLEKKPFNYQKTSKFLYVKFLLKNECKNALSFLLQKINSLFINTFTGVNK